MTGKFHMTAKTQINTLINGNTTTTGTPLETRKQIAAAVIQENPDTLAILINGVKLHLQRTFSTSGKTTWYESPLLSRETALAAGIADSLVKGKEQAYTLTIYGEDMRTQLSSFTRKPDGTWHNRYNTIHWIDNQQIQIL